ncbi:hypothetical protein BOX15_Mlig000251g2, partial [Macrostomum lignano]
RQKKKKQQKRRPGQQLRHRQLRSHSGPPAGAPSRPAPCGDFLGLPWREEAQLRKALILSLRDGRPVSRRTVERSMAADANATPAAPTPAADPPAASVALRATSIAAPAAPKCATRQHCSQPPPPELRLDPHTGRPVSTVAFLDFLCCYRATAVAASAAVPARLRWLALPPSLRRMKKRPTLQQLSVPHAPRPSPLASDPETPGPLQQCRSSPQPREQSKTVNGAADCLEFGRHSDSQLLHQHQQVAAATRAKRRALATLRAAAATAAAAVSHSDCDEREEPQRPSEASLQSEPRRSRRLAV